MANVFYLANPTPADITVNSQTALAGRVTGPLTITDTLTDLDAFVSKGCIAAPASLANTDGPVTDLIDSLTQLLEKGAFLLGGLSRAVVSAGSDTHAQAGL